MENLTTTLVNVTQAPQTAITQAVTGLTGVDIAVALAALGIIYFGVRFEEWSFLLKYATYAIGIYLLWVAGVIPKLLLLVGVKI